MSQIVKMLDKCVSALMVVTAIAISLQIVGMPLSNAQNTSERLYVAQQQINDQGRRLDSLEAMKIGERLSAIEALQSKGAVLQYTSNTGVVLLLLEALTRRRLRKSDSNNRTD